MSHSSCTSPAPLMHSLKQFIHRVIERDLGSHQISMMHGQILRFVAEEKSITMKDLAKHLSITPPSATSITESLVKKGWMERVTDKQDRRVVRIRVTPKGRTMMRKVRKSLEQEWGKVLKTMSATQQKQLKQFTEHLTRYTSFL